MPKSWKTVEIEQQCRYGFTTTFVTKLMSSWSVVKDYAFILHDRDINENGTPVEPHIHCMIRFNDSVPTTSILNKVGNVIEEKNLQKMYSWGKALAYLTHANRPDKHQYVSSDVVSNFNWQDEADNSKSKDYILSLIDKEIAKPFNITDYVSIPEYCSYKKDIENAFEAVSKRHRLEAMKGTREMQVFYVFGKAGMGKSVFAEEYCKGLGYSYCRSSSSNDIMQDYDGQDALIIDDFRDSNMSYSDFLKLTDPHFESTVKSRYRNKNMHYCKCIIVTSSQPITEIYSNITEERAQMYRRFFAITELKQTSMVGYKWDNNRGCFLSKTENFNPWRTLRAIESKSLAEQLDFAMSCFTIAKRNVVAASESLENASLSLDNLEDEKIPFDI